MNQRLACLSDYSRICADIWPLANGSRPICAAIVFGHADFADDADFFHRMTRNLFGYFLLRRLLTDFRRGDLFGRCRYPLRSDKAIHQRFHKKSVYICEICGTKFSSDFTDESEAVLLIGLLTDFRGTLAAGQWLAPDMFCYCFWSRRFRR